MYHPKKRKITQIAASILGQAHFEAVELLM